MRGSEVRFGPFRLDLERHKLSRDEAAIRLGGRALDILCELVAAQGRLVTKDELMARVWAGAIVEENAIQVHISALRKVLDVLGLRLMETVTWVPTGPWAAVAHSVLRALLLGSKVHGRMAARYAT